MDTDKPIRCRRCNKWTRNPVSICTAMSTDKTYCQECKDAHDKIVGAIHGH